MDEKTFQVLDLRIETLRNIVSQIITFALFRKGTSVPNSTMMLVKVLKCSWSILKNFVHMPLKHIVSIALSCRVEMVSENIP